MSFATNRYITEAARDWDHDEIMVIARQSPYTKDFSNRIYSSEEMYNKDWIGVAYEHDSEYIAGFVCVRHLVRRPYTSLYFLGVDKNHKRQGVGTALLKWVIDETPHKEIRILVANKNREALRFWKAKGFKKFEKKDENSSLYRLRIA